LPPEDGGECVRTMFVSLEVYGDVRGPFPHHQTGYRLSLFRGDLDGFTRGSWVSIADDPYNKKPWAFFAPVDPVRLGIWDIRSNGSDPQIRCFGGWAEKDVFVALTWAWRDDIRKFSVEAEECRKDWDRLFPSCPPYVGKTIDDYIKERYRVA
jgi:hypothetical protein